MEVKELVNTLHHSLTEVEDGDTLLDVEAEALADTLPDRLSQVKPYRRSNTVTDVKAAAIFRYSDRDTKRRTVQCEGQDTARDATLSDMEA